MSANPVPQAILDALQLVENDATTVTTDTAAVTSAQAAATAATTALTTAQATLTTDQATLAADLATAEALIQSTFGSAAPPASVSARVSRARSFLKK